MKKNLFWMFAAILFCGSPALAQVEPGTLSIIPKLGFLGATLTHQPDLEVAEDVDLSTTLCPGFLIGADVDYQVNDFLSLSAGLNYTRQGGKWKDFRRPQIEIKDVQMILGYVNLPVMANVYLFKGFAVKAGVQLSYLTNANSQYKLIWHVPNMPVEERKYDQSIMSECNKFDFSIPFGLSYEVGDQIILDARYNFGLSRLNKEKDPDGDPCNRYFLFTVGYRFPLN